MPAADRLSAVSAAGVDDDAAVAKGACSGRDQVQDQAADCAGADPRGSEGGRCSGVVLMDASYGNNSKLRQDSRDWAQLRRSHHTDRQSTPGARGRSEARASASKHWRSACPSAPGAPSTWREGTNVKLRSRFARVRVRAAPIRGEARFAEETLLIEWPKGEAKPPNTGSQPSTRTCRSPPRRSRQAALAYRARLPRSQAGNRPWTL